MRTLVEHYRKLQAWFDYVPAYVILLFMTVLGVIVMLLTPAVR